MNYKVSHPTKQIECEINLPASKSISNRLLIIQAICDTPFTIHNLSDSDDTKALKKALTNTDTLIDVSAAGTTFRFLSAYYAASTKEDITLTGSERMKSRPIKGLVTALNSLGAKISYLDKEGFPPLKISNSTIKGNIIDIDASVSSQFISALLLIAPTLVNGLQINIKGTIVSKPYIEMTLNLMSEFGIEYNWTNNNIHIRKQKYIGKDYTVEGDWSAASFWFEIAALTSHCNIQLKGLHTQSIQGDSAALNLFTPLGVHATFKKGILILKKEKVSKLPNTINLLTTPDLYQPLKCSLAALNLTTEITGLQTLKDKETDRVAAVNNELLKLGESNNIDTYEDHRMAMSFSPLSLKYGTLTINDISVVTKSYPNYWEDLKKAGFIIKPSTH